MGHTIVGAETSKHVNLIFINAIKGDTTIVVPSLSNAGN